MHFEYLIGMRYLRARRRERFVSLIAIISLAGVALGTFALTVVLSVMTGFQEDLRQRLLAFNPHITVQSTNGAAFDPAQVTRRIDTVPGIEAAAPYVSSQVMAVSTNAAGVPAYVAGGVLRGVVAKNNPVLAELKLTLKSGALDALDRDFPAAVTDQGAKRTVELPGAIIGDSLAFELGLRMGDPVVLISPASLGGGIGAPRLRRFVLGGLFHSGMFQYDSSLIFVSLKNAQALLADDPQLESGLELRVRDLFAAPRIGARLARLLDGGFTVTDWTQANEALFSALKLETFTYFLVLMLIVLVAAFNIVATLVMVVMERRKEIAILRTMGARAGSVAAIFLCEGAALGIVGTAVGVLGGLVTSFLIGKYHLIHLPPDMFMVSAVPVRLYAVNFVAVAVAAVVLCLAAALYPAFKARTLSPVEIIRYE
ncbi:MAG TPA: ABC transporter permease [Candidatus Binataceae bacterium]|nr:ABC transporter permease [Candidatus Binataceae bacterium]